MASMATHSTKKRKLASEAIESTKRIKISSTSGATRAVKVTRISTTDAPVDDAVANSTANKGKEKAVEQSEAVHAAAPKRPKHRIEKLVPPRPFPTVPTSVSATGPRSAHKEGKNCICVTRKTPLGAYLRRCKNVIMVDGYKTLRLSAMGAAIPHLLLLSVSLPGILPFAPEEIHTEILTGTVEVQDEVIPEDSDEEISYQTRGKSTLSVVIKIGDGEFDGDTGPSGKRSRHKGASVSRIIDTKGEGSKSGASGNGKRGKPSGPTTPVVFQEPEQDEMLLG